MICTCVPNNFYTRRLPSGISHPLNPLDEKLWAMNYPSTYASTSPSRRHAHSPPKEWYGLGRGKPSRLHELQLVNEEEEGHGEIRYSGSWSDVGLFQHVGEDLLVDDDNDMAGELILLRIAASLTGHGKILGLWRIVRMFAFVSAFSDHSAFDRGR